MTIPTHDEQIAALERAVLKANDKDGAILCSVILRLMPATAPLPTVLELSSMSANAGKGATRARLQSWGVPWPPPRGWLQKLMREAREREEAPHG